MDPLKRVDKHLTDWLDKNAVHPPQVPQAAPKEERDVRTEFEKVGVYAKKSGKCLCGKRRSRSEYLYQTVNPFNKNKSGQVKTREEVRADVQKEYERWLAAPILCDSCPKEASTP